MIENMSHATQTSLFDDRSFQRNRSRNAEWGSFKDSLKAPVHRWFTYPAGFSYRAVEYSLKRFNIRPGQTVYDPFMGSATTNVTAKTLGIDSIGVEAHPFVFRLAKAKLNWEVTQAEVLEFMEFVQQRIKQKVAELKKHDLSKEFPDLLLRCYETETLYDLWAIREFILNYDFPSSLRQFFVVVLTALLREVSTAATGWPYIAPKKKKVTSLDKNVLTEFKSLSWRMVKDLEQIRIVSGDRYLASSHLLIQGDARNTIEYIESQVAQHVFTSPPYLNNFDYADRTRLELYFWGEAKAWGDITTDIRTKLMTSATTQINRNDPKYRISNALFRDCPNVANFIAESTSTLETVRKTKGGKKSYDLMVIGYFNDIHQVLKDVYRVLKPNTKALFVLGDSAPYGIHIPTDRLIGDIAISVGFSHYEIEVLRIRGEKWKENPQRHSVPLRESIVIIEKG